jgi:hypothetical protein
MLEFVGVAVIGIFFVHPGFRGLRDYLQKRPDAYGDVKIFIGRGCSWDWNFWLRQTSSARDSRTKHGKDTVPRLVDCRTNAFELVHCGRSRGLLALAGCKEKDGLILW